MWQQAEDIGSLVLIGLLTFLISQSDVALHKFWLSENKKSFFVIKINILFFLTIWKQNYKINQLWNNPK